MKSGICCEIITCIQTTVGDDRVNEISEDKSGLDFNGVTVPYPICIVNSYVKMFFLVCRSVTIQTFLNPDQQFHPFRQRASCSILLH